MTEDRMMRIGEIIADAEFPYGDKTPDVVVINGPEWDPAPEPPQWPLTDDYHLLRAYLPEKADHGSNDDQPGLKFELALMDGRYAGNLRVLSPVDASGLDSPPGTPPGWEVTFYGDEVGAHLPGLTLEQVAVAVPLLAQVAANSFTDRVVHRAVINIGGTTTYSPDGDKVITVDTGYNTGFAHMTGRVRDLPLAPGSYMVRSPEPGGSGEIIGTLTVEPGGGRRVAWFT